ncbi:hypothetical protein GGR57DRAFT_486742 [Xylariaceae sp. FL1272]|nr:hypothetical protein GGR57DRAFT_486742 [Xylariaceae sp. FL1272]
MLALRLILPSLAPNVKTAETPKLTSGCPARSKRMMVGEIGQVGCRSHTAQVSGSVCAELVIGLHNSCPAWEVSKWHNYRGQMYLGRSLANEVTVVDEPNGWYVGERRVCGAAGRGEAMDLFIPKNIDVFHDRQWDGTVQRSEELSSAVVTATPSRVDWTGCSAYLSQ